MRLRVWAVYGLLLLAFMVVPSLAHAWQLIDMKPVTPEGEIYMGPSWSPDGKALAVTTGKFYGLFLADLAGKEKPKLLTDIPGAGFGFIWSDDSQEILFKKNPGLVTGIPSPQTLMRVGTTNGVPEAMGNLQLLGVSQKVPPLGKGPKAYIDDQERVVASVKGKKVLLTEQGGGYYDPKVSPKGDLVLVHNLDGHLYVLDLNGADPIDLGEGYSAVWSPKGDKILFELSRDDGQEITSSELFLVDSDGSNRQQVTSTPDVHEMHPDWASNGIDVSFDDPASQRVFVGRLVP